MAQASSASSSTAGIQSSGGNIINNASPWGAWLIAGLAVIVLAVVLIKGRKRK